MKYYVILNAALPGGATPIGFTVEAEDAGAALKQVQLAQHMHHLFLGFAADVEEVSRKKRRGVEYFE